MLLQSGISGEFILPTNTKNEPHIITDSVEEPLNLTVVSLFGFLFFFLGFVERTKKYKTSPALSLKI